MGHACLGTDEKTSPTLPREVLPSINFAFPEHHFSKYGNGVERLYLLRMEWKVIQHTQILSGWERDSGAQHTPTLTLATPLCSQAEH